MLTKIADRRCSEQKVVVVVGIKRAKVCRWREMTSRRCLKRKERQGSRVDEQERQTRSPEQSRECCQYCRRRRNQLGGWRCESVSIRPVEECCHHCPHTKGGCRRGCSPSQRPRRGQYRSLRQKSNCTAKRRQVEHCGSRR